MACKYFIKLLSEEGHILTFRDSVLLNFKTTRRPRRFPGDHLKAIINLQSSGK